MRITKKQSLVLTLVILGSFFIISSLFLNRRPELQQTSARPTPTASTNVSAQAEETPNSKSSSSEPQSTEGNFQLTEFHRSEVKNGRKLWEVHGVRGRSFPESSSAEIQEAHVQIYSASGDTSDMKADSAKVFLSGTTLSKGHAKGNVVVVRNDEVTLKTEEAIIDRIANTIEMPRLVNISSIQAEITADRLDGDLESKEFIFSGNVVTIIKPRTK